MNDASNIFGSYKLAVNDSANICLFFKEHYTIMHLKPDCHGVLKIAPIIISG